MSQWTDPVGGCAVEVLAALSGYGLDEDTIRYACTDLECTDTESCLFKVLLDRGNASSETVEGVKTGLDVAFLLFSAYLVFNMQLGFAMVSGCAPAHARRQPCVCVFVAVDIS